MKYKVGDRVRMFDTGEVVTILQVKPKISGYYVIGGNHESAFHIFENYLLPYKNRSKVGKKAYKTFLKNGGSRNSKGQFSKKKKIDWEKIGKELSSTYFNGNNVFESKENAKAFAKVFQKHGLIDKEVEI